MSNYKDRIFLHLLEETEDVQMAKRVLQSPLELSSEIIKSLFENRLDAKKEDLDKIKKFAAEMARAESLANDYPLARYTPSIFAFTQHFHRSFEARQGKVLEELMKLVLRNYIDCEIVPDKIKERKEILTKAFGKEIEKKEI
jgi:hypothetical protein